MSTRVQLVGAKALLKMVRPLTYDINQETRALHEERIGKVTCTRGCAFCCYQKQLANYFEGAVIAAQLELDAAWTDELENKLRWADKAMTEATHFYWVQQSIPCVFLKEKEHGKGECSVYPARPLSCATTFSANEDPRDCQTKESRSVDVITTTQLRILEIKAAMQNGADDEKLRMFTLPGAVLYARAKLKGLPLPDLHSVELMTLIDDQRKRGVGREEGAGFSRQAFDAVATRRLPGEPA